MLAKLMTVKVSISLSVMNDKHGSNPKLNMFKRNVDGKETTKI